MTTIAKACLEGPAAMFSWVKEVAADVGRVLTARRVPVRPVKANMNSWLGRNLLNGRIPPLPTEIVSKIENLSRETDALGEQPLWEGYGDNNKMGSTRIPNAVRTPRQIGSLYAFLVQVRRPSVVVEFGTAFGVSGMYFLAGLHRNRYGHLFTFEPNETWAGIAGKNLARIGDQFTLTVGTFENNINSVMPRPKSIDMALIDAIHTREFVIPQLQLVVERATPGAIIILDDIDFSDDMKACWKEISMDDRFCASLEVGGRVGMLEVG